jgi:hypothetical protein
MTVQNAFGGGNILTYSNNGLSAGNTYHIVVTWDRSGLCQMYVDGVLQTDDEDISAYVAADLTKAGQFAIGRPGNVLADYYFDGIIKKVGFWHKVLTTDEIAELGSGSTYPF